MTASSSEDVGSPGATVPFSLEPIFLELESGRYVEPLLLVPLEDLVSGRRGGSGRVGGGGNGGGRKEYGGGGGGGSGGGGGDSEGRDRGRGRCAGRGGADGGVGGAVSNTRVRVRYDMHLPALYFRFGENSRTILAGTVLPTVQGHVLCTNRYLCRL